MIHYINKLFRLYEDLLSRYGMPLLIAQVISGVLLSFMAADGLYFLFQFLVILTQTMTMFLSLVLNHLVRELFVVGGGDWWFANLWLTLLWPLTVALACA